MPPWHSCWLFANLIVGDTRRKVLGMTATANFEDILEPAANVDLVEEIRLRTWARRNYAPAAERDATWHPVIRDEMARKDRELQRTQSR